MLVDMNKWIKGWFAGLIISGIAVVFVFWGMSNYFMDNPAKVPVAKINGEDVTYQEFSELYQQYRQMREDYFRANKINLPINDSEIKEQVLESLIRDNVLRQNASQYHYGVSPEQINQRLVSLPQFLEEGVFSSERFEQFAYQMNLTPMGLRDRVAESMVIEQLSNGLALSTFVLPSEVDKIYRLAEQTRDVNYLVISANKYLEESKVEATQVETYYNDNKQLFLQPEQVSIDYVTMNLDDVLKSVQVSDEDVQISYQDNKQQYTTPESWHVAHILLSDDDKQAQADDIVAQLKAGADFAQLAKKYSDDTSSADLGGDLNWLTPAELPEEIQAALPSLTEAQPISKPIKSRYGLHIVKRLEHAPEKVTPLAKVKAGIVEQLKHQKANEQFTQLRADLENAAYEAGDSLQPIAEEFGLTLEHSALFTHQGGKSGITANTSVVDAAFSDEVLLDRNNSDLITLDDNTVAIIRVNKHEPETTKPLADVSAQIHTMLVHKQAQEKVDALGAEIYAKVEAGEDLQAVAKAYQLDANMGVKIKRDKFEKVNPQLVMTAFSMPKPAGDQVINKGFKLGQSDYAVVQLKSVNEGRIGDKDKDYNQYAAQLNGVYSKLEYDDYVEAIVNAATVKTYEKNMS